MRDVILILDDEVDRLNEMVPLLGKKAPSYRVETSRNAPNIIEWLGPNLGSCALISLDHDLFPSDKDAVGFDPGTGRDVADYLAKQSPVCPVIVHTTNTIARPGMIRVLEEADWSVSYVSPYSDVLWIREVWMDEVCKQLPTQD